MGFEFERNKNIDDDLPPKIPRVEFGNGPMFESLPEETTEEYVSRVMTKIVDYYKRESNHNSYSRISERGYYGRYAHDSVSDVFSHNINLQKLKEKLFVLDKSDDQKFSRIKNEKVFDRLKISIWSTKEKILNSGNENVVMDYFQKTNQRRDFFATNIGKDAHSYVSMMFALPEVFAGTKEGREYIHSQIDDKTIFLFGGGDSIRDLLKSDEFKLKEVINFDPYLKEETKDKDPNGVYKWLKISASDIKIREMVGENEIPKADEVWATYSVPFYLDRSEDIKELINNMTFVLNEGGNARISPIAVQNKEQNGESFETRKQTLLDSMKDLMNKDDYNITIFNDTLKIHKIKK